MYYYFLNTEEALEFGENLDMKQTSKLLHSIEHFKKEIAMHKKSKKTKSIKELNKLMEIATNYQYCIEALSVKLPLISISLSK